MDSIVLGIIIAFDHLFHGLLAHSDLNAARLPIPPQPPRQVQEPASRTGSNAWINPMHAAYIPFRGGLINPVSTHQRKKP